MKTCLCLILASASLSSAAEKKIQMKDLPAAVQQAVKQESAGASIRGFTTEKENGKITYEAEMTVNGHGKDVSFDTTGKVVSVEEEVAIDGIPAAARTTIQKAVGNGKLRKVESVTENGKSFYEASFRKDGKSSEVQVDANGAKVK